MRISDHGDDRYRFPDVAFVADFSSNVPSLPRNDSLWQFLTEQRALIHRYPEPEAYTLERQIADKLGISDQSVLVTNGATEAIYLIGHLYQGGRSVILQPTFSEYEHSAKLFRHNVLNKPIDDFANGQLELSANTVFWLCNPNNPTGITYDYHHLIEEISSHLDTTFVVDQSYAAFTPKPVLSAEEASSLPNCFVIKSLTKAYAIPGLRLGYVIANPQLIRALKSLKMPWSVNALAIEAGIYLLRKELPFSLEKLLAERKRWVEQLSTLGVMDIFPTDTHYFLAQLKQHRAEEVKSWLAHHYGLLIRNAATYPLLGERYIRLATQKGEENDLLTQALTELPTSL